MNHGRCLLWLGMWLLAVIPLRGQDDQAVGGGDGSQANESILEALIDSIGPAEKELAALRMQAAAATSEAEKLELESKIEAARKQTEQLRQNFRRIAAGVDDESYDGEEAEQETLPQQLEELLSPLMSELQDATAKPRQLEALRATRESWQKRRALAESALVRIGGLLERDLPQGLKEELLAVQRGWSARVTEANSEIELIELQIRKNEAQKKPLLETVSDLFSKFWRTRGLNLLLAGLVFAATALIGRRLYGWMRVASPLHRRRKGSLAVRAVDVAAAFGVVIAAVVAALLTLYVKGDWVLLTLAAILLFGVAWAARNTLPPYLEQIRLLLNLGPVREGERMVYRGLPWRIDKLRFYSEFSNPDLEGGFLRLPVRELTGMNSRPCEPDEPWFPTRRGDWVLLGDGVPGRIDHQTPEQVVLVLLGGSRRTYQVAGFLALAPENLSPGFRLSVQFGIDYRHQAVATTEVPAVLQARLLEELVAEVGRGGIRSLRVEFKAAGSSSLDYEIVADFSGGVAARWNMLRRLIPRVCVDVCNERGWVMPFTQITLHQAQSE